MNPIPIPILTNHKPIRCPHCHEIENRIEVCKHCKYEYPDEPIDKITIIFLWGFPIAAVIGVIVNYEKDEFMMTIFGVFFGIICYFVGVLIIVGMVCLIESTFKTFKNKK